MGKTIRGCANETLLNTLGISYDEYEKLDFDEQQKLMNEYHKKHPNKSKDVIVMIGGGDDSIFIKVPKGEKVFTPNGYFIAGESLEDNNKRWEKREKEVFGDSKKINNQLDKEYDKLDFKTWLYLYITHAVRVNHPPIVEVEDKRQMYIKSSKKNEVFVFRDYEEYKNYFLMYLDAIENDIIDLAIYTRGSKGQIIALKGLCERIIVKKKINEFYNSITQKQIEEIHVKGKLTPLEAVQLWEAYDLCIEGNKSVFSKSRCDFFEQNCHECLIESASHKLEHDPIELTASNSINKEKVSVKKKIPNKK